ncbi:MAG: hypothetical protein E4H36_14935 [Spirochaetales bacterium]|nr:MAG: hypothetical protein E4H36_14935 [Spirochaetales bacterium]
MRKNDKIREDIMTGRERLLITLKGERADCMPVSPFFYSNNVYEMFKYKPTVENHIDPLDFDLVQKYVDYADYFDFDLLHPLGLRWDEYVPASADNWDVCVTEEGRGDERRRITTVKTPGGSLRQTMNFRRSSEYLIVLALEEYLLKKKEDFDLFTRYAPPARFLDPALVRRVNTAVGNIGLAAPATHGAFNTLNQFRKLEDMMMDPVTDEGFYRAMMNWFLEWNLNLLRKIVEAGAEVIEIGGNLATSGVGPGFFKNNVMEYENRLAHGIHEAGALVIYHNCGDAAKIMHIYNDLEIDCWGYLTPPPFGDVDLDSALRTIRPDMALRGNVDQVEFMMHAKPEEIRHKVEEVVRKTRPRGNWLLSTTDFFFDKTPYENIEAFSRAGRDFGNYSEGL